MGIHVSRKEEVPKMQPTSTPSDFDQIMYKTLLRLVVSCFVTINFSSKVYICYTFKTSFFVVYLREAY